MGGAGTSPPPRRRERPARPPESTEERLRVGRARVAHHKPYVTCQVSIQVCFEIYSRFETSHAVRFLSGEVADL